MNIAMDRVLTGGRRIAVSLLVTLAALALLVWVMGANPLAVAEALWRGVFGSPFTIGQTLSITAVLALTGLAAFLPFRARLFNVGAEGQLFAGASAAASVALLVGDVPAVLPLSVLAAVLGGAVWALIPGMLRAYLGASEMIVSLLLNFVAALLAAYLISGVFPDTSGQSTRAVPDAARLPVIWQAGGVTVGVVLAVLVVVVLWIVVTRTGFGFGVRAIGLNATAAALAGFSQRRATLLSFAIGGGCAGLAGGILVLGAAGQLNAGLSSNYGFLGVVVALLAAGRVHWLPLTALLIAALAVGSNRLQLAVDIPFSMGIVVVGVLVLMLLATGAISIRRS